MNSPIPVYEVNSSEFPEYKKSITIYNNLIKTLDFLKFIIEDDKDTLDRKIKHGLLCASVVTYCKAYQHGGSIGFTSEIYSGLPGNAVAVHEHYINLRNKFFSHSSSIHEQTKLGLTIQGDIAYPANVTTSLENYDIEDLKIYYNLVNHAKDFVKLKRKELEKDYEKYIKTIDLNKFDKKPIIFKPMITHPE